MRPRVLIVDDEAGVRSALTGVLGDEGYVVEAVESGEACLDQVVGRVFDVIILDIWLPGIDGLDTLTTLRDRAVDAQVVMISGHGSIEAAVRAIKLGAFDFIENRCHSRKRFWSSGTRCGSVSSRWRTGRCGPTSTAARSWSATAG